MIFRDDLPRLLRGCFAEGDEGGEGGGGPAPNGGGEGWYSEIPDEGLRTAMSGFESQEKALEAMGYKPPDWRAGIQDEEARKFADSSTDPTDFARRGLEMRQKLAKAIVPPGKDATEEEIASFHEKLGVPKEASAYEFDVPEGYELTDLDKEAHKVWQQRFHDQRLTAEQAKALSRFVYEDTQRAQQELAAQDKKFADESDALLKREWGADAEENDRFATLAAKAGLGDDFEEANALVTRDGRLVLDHPVWKRMFARLGREQGLGQEGSAAGMSDDARETLQDAIAAKQKQIDEAQADGDSKRANKLYQEKLAMWSKLNGNQPIVGSEGRVV